MTDIVNPFNRRNRTRYSLELPVECEIDGEIFRVKTFDVSFTGFSLLVQPNFKHVESMKLRFSFPGQEPFVFDVTERYRKLFEAGQYFRIGVQTKRQPVHHQRFFELVSQALLRQEKQAEGKVARPTVEAKAERPAAQGKIQGPGKRRHSRVAISIPLLLGVGDRVFLAKSLEFSARGVGLVMREELPHGKSFPLKAEDPDLGEFQIWVEERNRTAIDTPQGKFWRLGVKILSADSAFGPFLKHYNISPKPIPLKKGVTVPPSVTRSSRDLPTQQDHEVAPGARAENDSPSRLIPVRDVMVEVPEPSTLPLDQLGMQELIRMLCRQIEKTRFTFMHQADSPEVLAHALDMAYRFFEAALKRKAELTFEITAGGLRFGDKSIFQEPQGPEALCFSLFRDGARRLVFRLGMPKESLHQFFSCMARYLQHYQCQVFDSKALFYEINLQGIEVHYVDRFWEDDHGRNQVRILDEQLRESIPADPVALFGELQSLDRFLPIFRQIDDFAGQIDRVQFGLEMAGLGQGMMVREGIGILFDQIEQVRLGTVEREFALISQISDYLLNHGDPGGLLYLLGRIEGWGNNAPAARKKQVHAGVMQWKVHFSQPTRMLALVNRISLDSTLAREAIFELLARLDRVALRIPLFKAFCAEKNEQKQAFLAEACVFCFGHQVGELTKKAVTLPDSLASMLLKGYVQFPKTAPVEGLVAWCAHEGNATRRALVRLCGLLQLPICSKILLQLLKAEPPPDAGLAKEAERVLSQHFHQEYLLYLLNRLSYEKFLGLDPQDQLETMKMIAQRLPAQAKPLLLELVGPGANGDYDSQTSIYPVRQMAAKALLHFGDEDAKTALKAAIKSEEDIIFASFCDELVRSARKGGSRD